MYCEYISESESFSFHINFYNNWNVFYDDDFIIQIIKHALDLEVNSTLFLILAKKCCDELEKKTFKVGTTESVSSSLVEWSLTFK